MLSEQIIDQIRTNAGIGDAAAYPEYTNAMLYQEATDKIRSLFSDMVVKARCGYWLKNQVTTTTTDRVRIPSRAVVGGLVSVEVMGSTGKYYQINEISPVDAYTFEWETNQQYPRKFYCEGGDIVLCPAPTGSSTVRFRYYLRPSQLCQSQSSETYGVAEDRGRITASTATTVTVNDLPYDMVAGPIISGSVTVDIIRPAGWFEPYIISAAGTVSGSTITFASGVLSPVPQVGDYLRVENQTDWPMLAEDFHRLLADAASVKVMRELNLSDRAQDFEPGANADWERFQSAIQPQVKSEPKPILIKRFGSYRW